MDVASELDRIFPASLEEANVSKVEDEFFAFMSGLSKQDYETALTLLPNRPKFDFVDTPEVHGDYSTGYTSTSVKKTIIDAVSSFAIVNYIAHASATEIIAHLLNRKNGRPGYSLRRIAQAMSARPVEGLFDILLSAEDKDAKERPYTVGEFEDYLDSLFVSDRIGMVEYALEELLAGHELRKKKRAGQYRINDDFERYFLRLIQKKRRHEFASRLKKLDRVYKARFAVEEINRELFVYSTLDRVKTLDLFTQIDKWYLPSEARRKVLRNLSVMEFSYFFDNLRDIKVKVSQDWPYKPHWEAYIARFMRDERFWHNLRGLNEEIDLGNTEAGSRIQSYRQAALGVAVIYAGVILLPIVIAVGIRAPGAVVSAFRWTGGRLLLATQYAYSTIRVFGLAGGTVRIATDIYYCYLSNPVVINQHIATGVEIALDLTGNESGFAPGASPSDMMASATQKMSRLASKSVAELATEAKTISHIVEEEIEFVEMIVKGEDGKFYRIFASVNDGNEAVIKLKIVKYESIAEQVELKAQKTIKFQSKPKNDNAALAQARGTQGVESAKQDMKLATAEEVNLQRLKATGTDGPVVSMGPTKSANANPTLGRTSVAADRAAVTGSRSVADRGAGAANKLGSAASKRLVKLKIDLGTPGAIQGMANAMQEEVVTVLRDPRLFTVFKQSLRTTEKAAAQAASDMAELGKVIGRYTVRTKRGVVQLEKSVSDAVWALPENLRGVLIEHALADTQYQGWFRAGQLDRGFFPQIDYAIQKGGMQMQASLKTVNPFAKAYEKQLAETLPAHLEEIVTAVKNGRAGGLRVSVILDVRFPPGSAVARTDLQKTLGALIPSDIKGFVSALVDEF